MISFPPGVTLPTPRHGGEFFFPFRPARSPTPPLPVCLRRQAEMKIFSPQPPEYIWISCIFALSIMLDFQHVKQ